MKDFNTDQRNRTRHKMLTRRGRTQEAYMQTSRALMREMVRLQTEIQVDLQVLTSAASAVARAGVVEARHQTFSPADADGGKR
jgi:hypothetical protein